MPFIEVLYEEQLGDGREWFMDTETPGFVDISIHFALTWMRSFRDTRPIFDAVQYPRTVSVSTQSMLHVSPQKSHPLQWLNRLDAIVKAKQQASPPPLTKISGTDAAKEILASPFLDISGVGFDGVEAKRLGVGLGLRISVRPEDTGEFRVLILPRFV